MPHKYPNTPIGAIFRSWTGQPPVGDSECQLCGLPMDDHDRIAIRLKGERPESIRLVCERCADKAIRSDQAVNPNEVWLGKRNAHLVTEKRSEEQAVKRIRVKP